MLKVNFDSQEYADLVQIICLESEILISDDIIGLFYKYITIANKG